MDGRAIATPHQQQGADDTDDRGHTDAGQRKTNLALLDEIPRTDANHEDGTRHPSARNGVEELHDGNRIEHQSPEIDHLVTHRVGIELHTYGVLHPRVGHENPNGRDTGSDTRHPSGKQVCTFAHLVPSEEHDGEERSLHKEGQDALDGERSTEDVAHKPRVVAPVGTEFEFEDDARGDAHGKIDGEEFHPELGGVLPKLIFLDDIKGLHRCHNDRQPEGERYENPMVPGRQSELRPRPID